MKINFGTIVKAAAVAAGALVGLGAIKKVNDYQTNYGEDDENEQEELESDETKEIETTGDIKEEKKGK